MCEQQNLAAAVVLVLLEKQEIKNMIKEWLKIRLVYTTMRILTIRSDLRRLDICCADFKITNELVNIYDSTDILYCGPNEPDIYEEDIKILHDKNLKFRKLRTTELKSTITNDFAIHSCGNAMVVQNLALESIVLNLVYEPDTAELFPCDISIVNVPTDRPATKLLQTANLRDIYLKTNVHEQQELGLDPIYVAERSLESNRSRLIQAYPNRYKNEDTWLAVITSYGTCQILCQNKSLHSWNNCVADVTNILITEVFPVKKSPADISSFIELSNFVNHYVCTSCAWHDVAEIIFVANAAGYIMAFKLSKDSMNIRPKQLNDNVLKLVCKQKINMAHICYLKSFRNYLIIADIDGLINLFELSDDSKNASRFKNVESLWKQKDQMSCRQVLIQEDENFERFFIICAKGVYVIVFLVSNQGKLLSSTNIRVPGIKITGLEIFDTNEFIATTITGHVFRLILTYNVITFSMNIRRESVEIQQFDMENIEILGVGTSMNKSLWFFLFHSNKQQPLVSKQTVTNSYIILCKPNTLEALKVLENLNSEMVNSHRDVVVAFRLDVWHTKNERYNEYLQFYLSNDQSIQLDYLLLRKLQIAFEISKVNSRRSSFKLGFLNVIYRNEMKFLELAIQITHILLRLEFLQTIVSKTSNLTSFQQNSVHCMLTAFNVIIDQIREVIAKITKIHSNSKYKAIMEFFVKLALKELPIKWRTNDAKMSSKYKDECSMCGETLGVESLDCPLGHKLTRCSVSFIQLPLFSNSYCAQCGVAALKKDEQNANRLTELFPTKVEINCIFCCFSFSNI